ncbi:MAG: GNAT family N-acetyltransferase [Candidatus Schekmanbacteria bacterium]|nr:GNAT family N-acetyltransferase [Candidatus Schekmanbacteria bacterium]
MTENLAIRAMTRPEVDTLIDWAAAEGWNPGLHDADIFWMTDPLGFVAAELDGELAGGGSIVAYGRDFGFMGFFIMRPDCRGRGLGRQLWLSRRDRLRGRLRPTAAIGMDGVFAMQPFYAAGGFVFQHRDLRFAGTGQAATAARHLAAATEVPAALLDAYDQRHFPALRPAFLLAWIRQPESRSVVALVNGEVRGYGVVRRCREGYKIGPLFADSPSLAEDLFVSLSDHAAGAPLYLDVPEINDAAMELARRHLMAPVFGCARMVLGPPPDLPHGEIYGVTSFELG